MIRLLPSRYPPAVVPPSSDRQSFSISDFVLAYLAGYVGLFVVVIGLGADTDTGTLLVGSLLGLSAGHLLGMWIVLQRHNSSFGAIGLHVEPSDGLYVIGGMALQIVVVAAFLPVAQWIDADESTQTLARQIPEVEGMLLRVGLIVAMALVVPVTEELMYRGLLPRVLGRWMGQGAAFAVAALVFAVAHLLGVAPDSPKESVFLLLPQLFLVGLFLGWQTMKRRRLGVSIFIHSGFNLIGVLALLFAPETFS